MKDPRSEFKPGDVFCDEEDVLMLVEPAQTAPQAWRCFLLIDVFEDWRGNAPFTVLSEASLKIVYEKLT